MILFKIIRYKNFISTGNVWTEIELNKHNTTLIIGGNGAGKSTILDALSFVLFGKAFRNINKPQLINSITQKHMVVEVEFSISNNEYKIIRGIKPGIFEVYKDGVLLNQSAEMKDYQEILEKQIIKVNHKSFCQVVVLGSATFQPFMQLPGGRRREIIEDLLDLQIFTTMNNLLKDKVMRNAEAINKCIADKRLVEEKLKLVNQHLLELQNNNEQMIFEKKLRIKETVEQIETLKVKYETFVKSGHELRLSIGHEDIISKKMNKLSTLQHQIQAKLDILTKDINFFNKHDNCPTCKQPIDLQFKCDTVEEKEKETKKLSDGLELLTKEYDETNNEINKIMKIHNEINDIEMEIRTVNTQIKSLNDYKERLTEEIANIKTIVEPSEDTKITDLKKEADTIKAEHDELLDDRHTFQAAATLLKDGGIKAKIIKQYIPIINKLINKYLNAMEFMCQFELNEEFNETIKSRFRDEFSYASFSEGEKMRINLAILFTWRAVAKMRNSINTNILIMDEVFDSSLDSNGTEEFLKIINSLTSDTNTFIISHKTDQLFDKFERVLKFQKVKNFSRIVE